MQVKKENKINAIIEYIDEKYFMSGKVPTMQEIADNVGLSKGATSKYISEMEQLGLIEKANTHYGLSTQKMKKAQKQMRYLPIVGKVACGTPILAEQNIESYITLGDFLGTGNYFVLKAQGDSMINAGISNGDYVIVKQQSTANEGQIVVAMTEDSECTLKRYYKDNKKRKIRLHPENDAMDDMYYDNIEIQGIAVKVLKDLDC